MKYILGFLFLVIIVLFETSVLPFFTVFGIQFSPLLVILLSLQFLGLTDYGYYGAFFGGILLDLFGGQPLGFSGLGLLLISGAVGRLHRLAEGSLPSRLLVTFLASAVFRLVQALPALEPAVVCRGGLLDMGLMVFIYPCSRYLLRNVFSRREIQVGV